MRWVGWYVSNPLKEEAQSRMNVLRESNTLFATTGTI